MNRRDAFKMAAAAIAGAALPAVAEPCVIASEYWRSGLTWEPITATAFGFDLPAGSMIEGIWIPGEAA